MQIEFNKTAKFFIEGFVTQPNIKMRLKHNTYDFNVVTIPSTQKKNNIVFASILPTIENSQIIESGIIYLKYGGHYTVEFFGSDNTSTTITDTDLFIKSEQVYYKTQIPENYAMPGNRATKSLPTEQQNEDSTENFPDNPIEGNKAQTYAITLNPGAYEYSTITIAYGGFFSRLNNLPNISLFNVTTNQNLQLNDPVEAGDVILIEKTDGISEAMTGQLFFGYKNTQVALERPENGDGRYLYVLCNQTTKVEVYDLDTSPTLLTSIPLPEEFLNLHYRPHDKTVLVTTPVAADNTVKTIDANPSSPTFNAFLNTYQLNGNAKRTQYDWVYDELFVAEGNKIEVYDPSDFTLKRQFNFNINQNVRFDLEPLNGILRVNLVNDYSVLLNRNNQILEADSKDKFKVLYSINLNKFVVESDNQLLLYDLQNKPIRMFKRKLLDGPFFGDTANAVIDPTSNKVAVFSEGERFGDTYIYDLETEQKIGEFAIQNGVELEIAVLYSPYTQRAYSHRQDIINEVDVDNATLTNTFVPTPMTYTEDAFPTENKIMCINHVQIGW